MKDLQCLPTAFVRHLLLKTTTDEAKSYTLSQSVLHLVYIYNNNVRWNVERTRYIKTQFYHDNKRSFGRLTFSTGI